MKLAVAAWNGRISPLFDTAGQVNIYEIEEGAVVSVSNHALFDSVTARQAAQVAEMGAKLLVCGAVSRPLLQQLDSHGVKVIPWISGNVDDVVQAFISGDLMSGDFTMPGCGRRRRRRHREGRGSGW